MEGVTIHKRPVLKNPIMICAWPGMGEVAFKAATYLAEKIKAEPFAEIEPRGFYYLTGNVIQEGLVTLPELPYGRFYYWKNPACRRSAQKSSGQKPEAGDVIIFVSNAQPDLARAEEYSRRILYVARRFKVKTMVSIAAMPQPIEHTQPPAVWFAATSRQLIEALKKYTPSLLYEGQISGMNGLFLGIAKREGFEGFCLLSEIPLYTIQIENPRASHAALEVLARMLHIPLDFTSLIEQTHIMETEINRLLDYLKVGSSGQAGPIGEEEIERIKKTLAQLTKLPVSMKEKIEKLFEQASSDISKASELKTELDKWNVYKEYEDRFLDLFRRREDKGN